MTMYLNTDFKGGGLGIVKNESTFSKQNTRNKVIPSEKLILSGL